MTTEQQWERQRRTFEHTAAEYHRWRPTYPEALFDDIRSYADLAPDDAILDIGTGTGHGTIAIAKWGNPLLALEPAPAMAELARTNLGQYPNVEVRTSRFEDAHIEPATYGLVTCSQAYHWLDPATRIERIADALYAYGSAAIFSNVQVNPEATIEFFTMANAVYREHARELAQDPGFRAPDDLPPHRLENSDLFVDLEQRTHPWERTLHTQEYVALMATHSPHAALEPDVRDRLLAAIASLIDDEFRGSVTEHHVAVVDLARRAA